MNSLSRAAKMIRDIIYRRPRLEYANNLLLFFDLLKEMQAFCNNKLFFIISTKLQMFCRF